MKKKIEDLSSSSIWRDSLSINSFLVWRPCRTKMLTRWRRRPRQWRWFRRSWLDRSPCDNAYRHRDAILFPLERDDRGWTSLLNDRRGKNDRFETSLSYRNVSHSCGGCVNRRIVMPMCHLTPPAMEMSNLRRCHDEDLQWIVDEQNRSGLDELTGTEKNQSGDQ